MADLKFRDFLILQNVLQLVSLKWPDPVCVLNRVLCDDLCVQLIKLYEVGVAQAKIFEEFRSFDTASLEEKIITVRTIVQRREWLGSTRKGLSQGGYGDWPALERVTLVLCRDTDYYDTVVLAVVEDATNLLLTVFVEEKHDASF